MSGGLLAGLQQRVDAMLADLADLVSEESPSRDSDATARCAAATAQLGSRLLGEPAEHVSSGGNTHLRWRFGPTVELLLLGHVDTVWPLGTLQRWPFSVSGGRASGPGVFDMKAGIVQMLYGLSELDRLDGIGILVTTDEEIGSPTSAALIAETVRGARAALVLEASAGGALKVARKGVSTYQLSVSGRAAHAGLEPERGVNAGVELAHQILALEAMASAESGTTVTPTTISGGTASNTVPACASVHIDVRAATRDEQERVHQSLVARSAVHPEAVVTLTGGINRPPLEESSSAHLFRRAQQVAATLGMRPLRGVAVGGGSDGNLTAGAGVPTLDGLGAVGDHAHAEGEYVEVSALPERAALVAALVEELQQ